MVVYVVFLLLVYVYVYVVFFIRGALTRPSALREREREREREMSCGVSCFVTKTEVQTILI